MRRTLATVMIVDDDTFILEVVKATLKRSLPDLVTHGFESARAAIAAASNIAPYLVLLDLKMPDMDGFDAVPKMRERIAEDVPIIIMTAFKTSRADEEQLLGAGANGFLKKPFDPGSLVKDLERCILESQ